MAAGGRSRSLSRRWWAFLRDARPSAALLWYYSQDLTDLDQLQNYQPSLVTQVYSTDKQLIGQFFIERRILTPLPQIPEHLRRAVIAVEDVRFFEHPGLDYIGILRAAWTNLRRGGKVEGASTITQQLARSLFLSSERTFDRKVRELVLAYKMELVSSKEQIFETYLNQIYFGQGAYGVGVGRTVVLRQGPVGLDRRRGRLSRRTAEISEPFFAV